MIDSKDSSRHWQNLSLMFFRDEWEETSCDIFGSSQNIFGGVRLCQSRPQLFNHSFFPLCASATKDTFRRQRESFSIVLSWSIRIYPDEWEETSRDIFGSYKNIFGGVRWCQSRRPQPSTEYPFYPQNYTTSSLSATLTCGASLLSAARSFIFLPNQFHHHLISLIHQKHHINSN